jgi:hypothetical protein
VRNNPPDVYYDGDATRPYFFKRPHRTSLSSEADRDVNVISDTEESGSHGRRRHNFGRHDQATSSWSAPLAKIGGKLDVRASDR